MSVLNSLKDGILDLQDAVQRFAAFIGGKLSDYRNISLGEQMAYPLTVIGLLCLIIAVILFLV